MLYIHALTRLCLVLTGFASGALYWSQSALPGEALHSIGRNSTQDAELEFIDLQFKEIHQIYREEIN